MGIDERVLGFTLIGVLFLHAALRPPARRCKSPAATHRRRCGLEAERILCAGRLAAPKGNALIIAELALAMVLLCGAGLDAAQPLFRSSGAARFRSPKYADVSRSLPNDWDSAQQTDFYAAALRRIEDLPGSRAGRRHQQFLSGL